MSTEVCDCPNQTEIIIPIKQEQYDKRNFQSSIFRQLSYFRFVKYIGLEKPDTTILFEDEHCIILEKPPIQECHIVLGNVAYNIDFKAIGLDVQSYGGRDKYLQNCGVGLKFDIGDLQPTLSRESLFWNDKVKEKVLAKLKKARKSVRVQLEAELSAETDYARWFANVNSKSSVSFPRQWDFADIKSEGEFDLPTGTKLEIRSGLGDWFNGHTLRAITRYSTGFRRRGNKRVTTPDYSSGQPSFEQIKKLPCYKIEKNLNGRTCLWLFKSHPEGFLVINDMSKVNDNGVRITNAGVSGYEVVAELEYYEATKAWVSKLPVYDDIVVPEGEFSTTSNRDMELYKETVKLRKLEGKFTSKQLNKSIKFGSWRKNGTDEMFEYNMYEGKFEAMEGKTIVYGFQEDDKDLRKVLAWLVMSAEQDKNWHKDDLLFLKISQQYSKQFAQMQNAHYVGNVLALKTPLTAVLATYASAFRIKEDLAKYHILTYFGGISRGMTKTYQDLHSKVEDKLSNASYPDAVKDLLELCKDNLDKTMEDAYKAIKTYFVTAELLMCPNFGVYTDCNENEFAKYLGEYVELNQKYIREFLMDKDKHIDHPKVEKQEVVELLESVE